MSKVYILGAGASKFANFPLGVELWDFLINEWKTKSHEDHINKAGSRLDEAVNKIRQYDGEENDVIKDLELVFSKLDLSSLTDAKTLISSAFKSQSSQLIGSIYGNTAIGCSGNNSITKIINQWERIVQKGDTIITFNWDLLQEMIFFSKGKWHYRDGYGFEVKGKNEFNPSQILILKLHGSCNWAPYSSVDYLDIICPHFPEFSSSSKVPGNTSDYGQAIINPSYLKNPHDIPVLRELWPQAKKKIEEADEIFIIGYSLPQADKHAKDLFSKALLRSSIDEIKFIGKSAYSRWEEFCAPLGKNVNKIGDKFEDFVGKYSASFFS